MIEIQPSPSASVITSEGRIGVLQPAAWRDPVGFVVAEPLGNSSANRSAHGLATESEWMAATPLVLCEPTTAR